MRLAWFWPVIIILSAGAAAVVTFVMPGVSVRPVLAFWFLFICPGMAVVRFLRLKEAIAEWTLALALSFSLDALVSGILVYLGKWSPAVILIILMGFSVGGALLQLVLLPNRSSALIFPGQDKSE